MLGSYINLAFTAVMTFIIFKFGYPRLRKTWLAGGCLTSMVVFLTPVMVLFLYYLAPLYYLEPYEGQVVDEESGEPISDAVVVVVYQAQGPTVAGTISWYVDARETLTDEKGEFHFPSHWEIRFFGGQSPYGEVMAWKPGYSEASNEWLNYSNSFWLLGEEHRMGPPPYAVYEIRELRTKEERKENIPSPVYVGDIELPIFYCLIDQECIYVGLPPYRFDCD